MQTHLIKTQPHLDYNQPTPPQPQPWIPTQPKPCHNLNQSNGNLSVALQSYLYMFLWGKAIILLKFDRL